MLDLNFMVTKEKIYGFYVGIVKVVNGMITSGENYRLWKEFDEEHTKRMKNIYLDVMKMSFIHPLQLTELIEGQLILVKNVVNEIRFFKEAEIDTGNARFVDIGEGPYSFLPTRTEKINQAVGFPRRLDCATDLLILTILME